MFGFYNTKPRKDVLKRPDGKSKMSVFFEIFFRKIWKICRLSMLYSLCATPIFIILMFVVGIMTSRITDFFTPLLTESQSDLELTKIYFDLVLRVVFSTLFIVFFGAGPVSAGFSYVLRNFAKEEHAWISSDFFQHTKANLKQSIMVFIIDIAVFCLLFTAFMFYSSASGPLSYMKYVVVFSAFLYMMIHLYIYPLMVTFDLSLKDIFKNAVIFAVAESPRNVILLIITAIIHFVIPYFCIINAVTVFALPLYFIFEFIGLVGITGFMSSFFTYPSIEMLIDSSNQISDTSEI